MKPKRPQSEKSPVELVEEAVHLLRRVPASALVAYYLGTLPFLLALLYFWSDMARSAFAHERLITGTLGLSALFIWMKCWHAVYASHLLTHLCGEMPPRWSALWLLRTAVYQTILQSAGLFILPVSLVLLAPLGWTYAFFTNATVFAGQSPTDPRTIFLKSWRQANLWPMQSQFIVFLFKMFGLVVFINLLSAVMGVPFLLKMMLGIETVFTLSPWAALNTTMLAGVTGLTFLCIDPLLKATYVLRCFYGESLRTGEDLKADLKTWSLTRQTAVLAAILVLLHCLVPSVSGADNLESDKLASLKRPIAPDKLNRTIDEVIQQREYGWRLPRETAEAQVKSKSKQNFIESFFEQIEKGVKEAGRALKDFFEWLFGKGGSKRGGSMSGDGFATVMRGLIMLLIIALVGLIVWLLFRLWQQQTKTDPITAEALPPAPDVSDENVGADQLPEDGWLTLARELMGRGELRLALRAFYLSTLAHLAEQNLITLARFKSNLDYERELNRRGHALAEVPGLFAQNVATFERVWYGLHGVTPELVQDFATNVERMKGPR